MGRIFGNDNPGLGGLDELTDAETLFIQNLSALSYAQGDILYHNGTSLTRLPAGTSGYYLKTLGAGANPTWDVPSASVSTLDDVGDVTLTGIAQGHLLYRNATGWVNLAVGTSGQFLKTQGAGANPVWADVSATPGGSDTQVQFNDAGTLAGEAGMTYNKTTDTLTLAGGIVVGSSNPFSDSAGTLTLQNVDALDATTEATIESAIDTLANLTSIQGKTFTLAGNFVTSGAFALTLTQTGATNVTLPTTGTLSTLAGSETLTNKTLTTPVLNGTPTGTGVGTAATASTLALRDSNGNITAANQISGYTTTATAAGTTTLTVSSNQLQFFTGSTTQTVVMPVASTLVLGQTWYIVNNSTGAVTVNSSGGNAIVILAAGTYASITCILTSGTSAASWSASYDGHSIASGKKFTASNTLTLTGTDGSSVAFGAGGTVIYSGGALGTPSSGTLTSCSGLPVSGITASTVTALGVGSIELGHASDTTIARVSAGVVSIEGVNVVTVSSTDTLTNKTLTAPKFADAGYIADNNGNEQIKFSTTASAVNEFTVKNAATGGAPDLQATGGDTNIDIKLTPKGSGKVAPQASVNFGAKTAYFTETDNGNSSTADTIDWTVSNKQKSTLTGNCTFTFTAPPGPCSLILKLVQDATGSRTVTWPAAVHWPAGTAPTLTTTANKVDIISFYYDGTTYFGNSSLNFTA